MNKIVARAIVCTIVSSLFFVSAGSAEPYKIGAGDVLKIEVWKNPDLTATKVALPDGTIHFPLIGELKVEGMSATQLEKKIISLIDKYVSDPIVTVTIEQVNSLMIYVIGKVNRPGRFILNDDVDVLQALSLAGGLNPFAKEKEIKIFRKKGIDTAIFNFDYKQVSQGENLEQNMILNKGDVIVVR